MKNIISYAGGYGKSVINVGGVTYSNFLLQNVVENWGPQLKIDSGYEDWWVKLIGTKPKLRKLTGIIPAEYVDEFIENYKSIWRISQCLKSSNKVKINYKDRQLSGYITGLRIIDRSNVIPSFEMDYVAVTETIIQPVQTDNTYEKLIFDRSLDTGEDENKATIIYKREDEGDTTYDDFILLSVVKQFNEKYSLIDLSGDNFNMISYGSAPDVFNFNIALSENNENSLADATEFLKNVKQYWQLSVDNKELIKICYRDRMAGGIMTDISSVSARGDMASMSFGLIANNDINIPISTGTVT